MYTTEDEEERRLSESISGKLVMCFNSDPMEDLYVATRVQQLGGVGVIISKTLCDIIVPVADGCPFVINVNYEVGNKLHRLLEANRYIRYLNFYIYISSTNFFNFVYYIVPKCTVM